MVDLLPCPFCGGAASLRTYETESLWSSNQVTYTSVGCDECDCRFATESGFEVKAPEQWNTRAATSTLQAQCERQRVALEADKCGAVSDDAIKHLAIRDQLNRTIYKAVREYQLSNMCCDDDQWCAYPLVDLMSNPAPGDISTGEMEMIALADEIAAAVSPFLAAPASLDREGDAA